MTCKQAQLKRAPKGGIKLVVDGVEKFYRGGQFLPQRGIVTLKKETQMKTVIDSFKANDKGIEREVQLVEENGKLALYATFSEVGLKKVNCPNPQELFEDLKKQSNA